MNSIHDMGGMHGFGPIPYEEDEPVFHHEWEARVFAITTQTPVAKPFNPRTVIEQMDPADYLATTYYEKWLYMRTQKLIDEGTITQRELDTWIAHIRATPDYRPPHTANPERLRKVLTNIYSLHSHRKEADVAPAFQIGDEVQTRNMHPVGHTRLPRYARNKRGVVVNYYGIQECYDDLPSGTMAAPQPLYAVRFDGQELWGESAEPKSVLYLDMWEMYLIT